MSNYQHQITESRNLEENKEGRSSQPATTFVFLGFALLIIGAILALLVPSPTDFIEGSQFRFKYIGTSSQSHQGGIRFARNTETNYFAVYEGEAYGTTHRYTYHSSFDSSADAYRFSQGNPTLNLTSYIYDDFGQDKVRFISSDSTLSEEVFSERMIGIGICGGSVMLLLTSLFLALSDRKRGKTIFFHPFYLAGIIGISTIIGIGLDYTLATFRNENSLPDNWQVLSVEVAVPTLEPLERHISRGGYFSFDIPRGFEYIQDDFYSNEASIVGIQDIFPMGTPEDAYASILSIYTKETTPISITEFGQCIEFSLNGIDGIYGDLLLESATLDHAMGLVRIAILPSENIIFTLESVNDSKEIAIENMDVVFKSLMYENANKDFLTGESFISRYDGSQLVLNFDGSYVHYNNGQNHEHGSKNGTYQLFSGVEAYTAMTNYGSTYEELSEYVSWCQNGYILGAESSIQAGIYQQENPGDFRAFPLDWEREIVSSSTFYLLVCSTEEGDSTSYLGFYIPIKGVMEMRNLNDGTIAQWAIVE